MKGNRDVGPKSSAGRTDDIEFYGSDSFAHDVDKSIGYLIKLAHKQLVRNVDEQLQAYDLTAMQWVPLQIISAGRGDTVASCAREAGVDAGAMTRMLDRLEAKGLVYRNRSDDDRRVVNIKLTNKGRRIVKNIPQAISNVLNHHLRGFNKEEFKIFQDMLHRLLANGEMPVE